MPLEQQLNGKKLHVVSNYQFTEKLLGKGNFARVEEAIHNILDVKVAIKIMDIKKIKEEYVIKNLCREARIMGKLNHPCICALYQTMQQSNHIYYLVTELAGGGDLCTFVKEQRNGRLEETTARIYIRQFVSALAHMHSLGVVHRDLKMENVMLNSSRTLIKIVDFGLSNLYHSDNPLKTHCGSPEYAAPELFISGRVYGPEVDVWSLGIILYGLVVGQLPFASNRNEKTSSSERRKRLIVQINRGLGGAHKKKLALFSVDFRHVLERMLMPDSAKRISVNELIKHSFITEKGSKHIRRNPMTKLEMRRQADILTKISELTHKPVTEVAKLVDEGPYSTIGGMYNILAHKLALRLLSGDGITKILPSKEDGADSRRYNRPSTARNFDLPKIEVQNKRPAGSAQTPTRPKVDCRWSSGPPLRPKPLPPATPKSSNTGKDTKELKKVPFWLPSAPKNVNKDAKSGNNRALFEKKSQVKEEKLPTADKQARRATTALGTLRKAPNVVARPQTSLAPVKESRLPVCRYQKATTARNRSSGDKVCVVQGDVTVPKSNQKLIKPPIYGPIAKSIADYVRVTRARVKELMATAESHEEFTN